MLSFFSDNVKSGATRKGTDVVEPTDDTVMVNDDELEEVEVIEENFDDDNEADGQNDPQRLSTVQEIDATNAAKNDTATSNAEMQRARAIKCRKNRRRRRRSTGSHESSSVSEEEGDGTGRRGKQRGKHARRQRMSRSLSFGSSADSHDDFDLVNGHRCVRFNPVPEVRLFSNRADKRKWKEVRKQQLLTGNTEPENTVQERTCKLKSSLKDTSRTDKERLSISSDDGLETAVTDIITDNGDDNHNNDYVDSKANDVITDDGDNHDDDDDDDDDVDDDDDDDVDDEEENGDSFVKVEKPELTNPLIFDLDD